MVAQLVLVKLVQVRVPARLPIYLFCRLTWLGHKRCGNRLIVGLCIKQLNIDLLIYILRVRVRIPVEEIIVIVFGRITQVVKGGGL